MRKELVQQLINKATEVAENFSKPDRDKNFQGEKFTLDKIIPLSEDGAAVKFLKSSGKFALAFFHYMHSYEKWYYFFPTDGHILAMQNFLYHKLEVEKHNFNFNGVTLDVKQTETAQGDYPLLPL